MNRRDPFIGLTLSHYRILKKIGEGGMGVVYRAKDLKLKRRVAIKFLRPELIETSESKKRFIQEAQAASALDHPNICTVHEIDKTKDGRLFIVTACYEGETLQEKLTRGPLPIHEACSIFRGIAQGLKRAHEAGIVHRDIKPANIMITNRGEVKILDFGLAKLSNKMRMTKTGIPLGTAAYMSPEQADGKAADHRTDIWSLGLTFYEMLTGRLPFPGDSEVSVLHAILHDDPVPLDRYKKGIPTHLQALIDTALEKKPGNRHRDIQSMLNGLERDKNKYVLFFHRLTKKIIRKKSAVIALTLACLTLCIGISFLHPFRNKDPEWLKPDAPMKRLTSEAGKELGRISPDGKYLVYMTQNEKYEIKLKDLTTGEIKSLGTSMPCQKTQPCWSPDGTQIAFSIWSEPFVKYGNDLGIATVSLLGSFIHRIKSDGEAFYPSWSPDGQKIAFVKSVNNDAQLRLVISRLDGSIERELPKQDTLMSIAWHPDSKTLALIYGPMNDAANGEIRMYHTDSGQLDDPLPEIELKPVGWWSGGAAWTPDGSYLVYSGRKNGFIELFALPMNPKTIKPTGLPRQITHFQGNGTPSWPTFTRDGLKLSYGIYELNRDINMLSIDLHSRKISGHPLRIAVDRRRDDYPCWTPDENGVVFISRRDGQPDIYRYSLKTGETKRLTYSETDEKYPQVSPDGKTISFHMNQALWGMSIEGGTLRRLTPKNFNVDMTHCWAPDGKRIFVLNRQSKRIISETPLYEIQLSDSSYRVLLSGYLLDGISISPNGQWLVYQGSQLKKDSLSYYRAGIVNIKSGHATELFRQPEFGHFGWFSWTPDSRCILYQRPEFDAVFEMIPIDGGVRKRLVLNCEALSGDIYLGPLSPSGGKILMPTETEESDIWVRGDLGD